jgi:hypothetical protein
VKVPILTPLLLALVAAYALAAPRAASAQAPGFQVPDAETRDPPTQMRVDAVCDYAATSGWNSAVVPLRIAAVKAYRQDRFAAAEAWFHLYRWAALFSEPENLFIDRWVSAIEANHLNYEGVAGEYHASGDPIGLKMSQGLQGWVLSNEAFSQEFFSNLKPVDHIPNVFAILDLLYQRDPARFSRYASLALAIALVYDVPPPPYWPHGQVTAQALPRKLAKPEVTYDRLIQDDQRGRTYFRVGKLRAEELKFVVDTAAPPSELEWAVSNVPYPLDQLEEAYSSITYRLDRAAETRLMIWSGRPYTLQAIKSEGGICIDQAYYASEVGKARGVPTLLFTGGGQDGRHAWFGYLDGEHRWRLDAGRYAEQRLVTGIARDPQTWLDISDHELQFLSERFHALPSFMQSRIHEEFAGDFLMVGDFAAAAHSARSAVNFEKRNINAWEILIAANSRLGLDAARQEGVMREASLAFTPRYPDLVASYSSRICQSLRARGESSLADYEERGLAERFNGDRTDLAVKTASAILERSIATQTTEAQVATYNAIIARFGHGAGTLFFDQIVVAFAEHLSLLKMKPQAREAVERAREALAVQPGTQFALEVDKLLERLQD